MTRRSGCPKAPRPSLLVAGPAERTRCALGMWLFLATEMLLFAGLFVGYAGVPRSSSRTPSQEAAATSNVAARHHQHRGADHLQLHGGAGHPLRAQRQAARRPPSASLLTSRLALGFLGHQGASSTHEHFREARASRQVLRLRGGEGPGGRHVLHALLPHDRPARRARGGGHERALRWMASWRTAAGPLLVALLHRLELGGLYWHLVDLVWIFLYPLLYLI